MKKSFLKRVAAAAVAVPVALSQTVLFTSFAEGDAATDSTTVSVDTFLNITPDADKLVKASDAKEGQFNVWEATKGNDVKGTNPYYDNAYVQVSTWNERVKAACNALADGTVYDVEATRLKNSINPNSRYSRFLKEILEDGSAKVSLEVKRDEAVITIDGVVDVVKQLENLEDEELDEYEALNLDFGDKGQFDMSIVLTVDLTQLTNSEELLIPVIPVAGTIITDKGETTIDEFIELFQEHFDMVKAYAEEAVNNAVANATTEEELAQAIDARDNELPRVCDKWQKRINRAKRQYKRAEDIAEVTYTGATFDDVLKHAREDAMAKGSERLDRIPETIDEALTASEYATAVELFEKVVNQANEQAVGSGYQLDVTTDDLVKVAKDAYDIEVSGTVENYFGQGETVFYVPDDLDAKGAQVYIDYFNSILPEGEVVDEIFSVKAVEASGLAYKDTLKGVAGGEIYRVVWYTTTTEEPTETPSEEPSETPSEEPSETPSETPTETPSETPTETPSETPTETPSENPSEEPSENPSEEPTDAPAIEDVEFTTKTGFYFAHDPNSFDVNELIESATTKDGEAVDLSLFTIESNPKAVYEESGEAYVATDLEVFYNGEATGKTAKAYIGVKGDADLSGVADASDAASILIYAAAIGAGEDAKLLTAVEADDTLEAFAYFLADTDGESRDHGATTGIAGTTGASPLNATDAANVLIYSAIVGAQGTADWIDELDDQDGVLSTPYPAYSEKIATTAGLIK